MKTLQPVHPIEGAEAFEMKPGRLIVVRCPSNVPHETRRAMAEDLASQVEGTGVTVVMLPHGYEVEAFLAVDAQTQEPPAKPDACPECGAKIVKSERFTSCAHQSTCPTLPENRPIRYPTVNGAS